MIAVAKTPTDKAARYMTQLARHWSHKFQTELDGDQARIFLPFGRCDMLAAPGGLEVRLDSVPEIMTRLQDVVADHLNRFAFREGELRFQWVEC